jgi:hypothetical protein
MDVNSAVALLKAAGDDIDALSQAIIKAEFLDTIPGEDRQKLRGTAIPLQLLLSEALSALWFAGSLLHGAPLLQS